MLNKLQQSGWVNFGCPPHLRCGVGLRKVGRVAAAACGRFLVTIYMRKYTLTRPPPANTTAVRPAGENSHRSQKKGLLFKPEGRIGGGALLAARHRRRPCCSWRRTLASPATRAGCGCHALWGDERRKLAHNQASGGVKSRVSAFKKNFATDRTSKTALKQVPLTSAVTDAANYHGR